MSNDVTVTMPREYWEQVVKCIDIALAPKPELKLDLVKGYVVGVDFIWKESLYPNLKLIFDGETKELKSAEVIK